MDGKGRVAVTGASGLIGSRIVLHLLEAGFNVVGFVRDTTNENSVGFLKSIGDTHPNQLELRELPDLLSPPADLADRLAGCRDVIHAASPVVLSSSDDPEKTIIQPAVNGTLAILKASVSAGVRRVVLTASMASICGSQRKAEPTHVWTEKDWNDEMGSPYTKSKTLAEKAAWDFVGSHPLELVTIHPALVIGPVISERVTSSMNFILDLLKGKYKDGAPSGQIFGLVDVRDIANAHVQALLLDQAKGQRYIVASREQNSLVTIAEHLRSALNNSLPSEEAAKYTARLPGGYLSDPPKLLQNSTDSSKVVRELGITLTPPWVSLQDSVQSLLKLKLID